MKRILSVFIFLLSLLAVSAQTTTLTFTGRDANNHFIPLNRVVITNLTRGWQETIYYPDTILVMSSVGIEDYGKVESFNLSQNSPNPFDGTSDFSLCLPKDGQVSIEVYDLNGKKITSYNNTLTAGCHVFRVLLSTAQSYFLTARSGNDQASIKMINTGNAGSNALLYICEGNMQPLSVTLNNDTKGESTQPFTFGDMMEYVGYAIINGQECESQRISQQQGSSQSFILQFSAIQAMLPTVTTTAVSNITQTSATCGGNVMSDGGSNVTNRGVCYNTTGMPTISDNCFQAGMGVGSFTINITGLTVSTTYYIRAYAINSVGVSYGDVVALTTMNSFSCGSSTLTDVDGNVYNTVQIGQQCWMKENLRTTKYANNTTIALGSTTSTTTAYRYYPDNDSSNVPIYGYLYNWKAVMCNSSTSASNPSGIQGICPTGWHVPSGAEWAQLTSYIKSQSQYVSPGCTGTDDNWTTYCIAKALASTIGWNDSYIDYSPGNNPSSNNATGFSAVPSGRYPYYDYGFSSYAIFWSSTQSTMNNAYYRYLYYNSTAVHRDHDNKKYCGFSVRCLKDDGLPIVTTTAVSGITQSTAFSGGNVTTEGGSIVTARGVCWSMSQNPTIDDSHTSNGSGTGSFTSNMTGLQANTDYYVRAYAINNAGVAYGNALTFFACSVSLDGQPCPNAVTITDVDGNIYNTLKIGHQCWMKENLKTTKYADNTSISMGSTGSYTHSYTVAYRYYPNDDSINVSTYGYLYNWKAVMRNSASSGNNPSGVQGICPIGWHVPSKSEWTQLTNYVKSLHQYVSPDCTGTDDLFYTYCIAKALASTTGWNSSSDNHSPGNNPSSNNATGFSALPACDRYGDFGNSAGFWACTCTGIDHYAEYCRLSYNDTRVLMDYNDKICGCSVRCLKD